MSEARKAPDIAARWLPISFPISQEVFVSCQEHVMGRRMSDGERGAVLAWLDLFNLVSVGKLDGAEALEYVDRCMEKAATLAARHFLRAARYWLSLAIPKPPYGPEGGPVPAACPAP